MTGTRSATRHPNPLLAAQKMIYRERARRWWRRALGATLASALALAWLLPSVPGLARWSAAFIPYAGVLACGAGVYGASAAHRLHGRLLEGHRRSWLAGAPVSAAQRRAFDRWMVVCWFMTRALAASAVFMVMFLVLAAVDGHGRAHRLVAGGAVILAAFAAGTLAGWRFTVSALAAALRSRRARHRAAYQRRPYALSGPHALIRLCWTRLGNEASGSHMAILLTPMLLLIPAGTGTGTALCVLGVWVCLTLYADLWRVARRTLAELAQWLAATPLPRWRLIWLAGRRPLAVCLAIAMVAAMLLRLLGWSLADAVLPTLVPALLGLAGLLMSVLRTRS